MSKFMFCPKCGNKLEPKMKECPGCGKKLKGSKKALIIVLIILISAAIITTSILLIMKAMNDEPESSSSTNTGTQVKKEETAKDKYKRDIEKHISSRYKVSSIEELEPNIYDLVLDANTTNSDVSDCVDRFEIQLSNLSYSTNTKNVSLICGTTKLTVESFDTVKGTTYTYVVGEEGKELRTVTKAQLEAEKVANYKNSCTTVDYKDSLRYPDKYKGTKAHWFGEIVQVVSKSSTSSTFRISVDCVPYQYIGGYSCPNTLYVVYYGSESFIEDDMVNMWGTMEGNYTYTTVMNASMTIPKFYAQYMELAG